MKIRRYCFNVILLFINSVGIVGALAQVLEFPWRRFLISREAAAGEGCLEITLFWCGIFLFCAAAVLLQMKAYKKRTIRQIFLCVAAYVLCGLLFRKTLLEGLAMVLENAVDNLSQRYQFRMALVSGMWLPDVAEWTDDSRMWCAVFSALYLFLPLVLSGGFLWKRFRGIWLMAGNILWFYAACVCDKFPDFFFLTVSVLGIAAALIQQNFEKNPRTGLWAVSCAVVLTGGFMAVSLRFLMPVLDVQYDAIREERFQFYTMVNSGDWSSVLKNVFSQIGFGKGVDVKGTLGRQNIFSDVSTPVYRVTADKMPQGTLYLKGFVGKEYSGKAWDAAADRELVKYYREQGMELPEDYSDLVNISYEAGRVRGRNSSPRHIIIEELGGKGSYSLYPSGAMLTEEFKVHSNGSVARRARQYEFSYYELNGSRSGSMLSGKWGQTESRYAKYVYDNFLAYDEEAFPRLTESLEQEKIRTDSIYTCVMDVMNFLQRQASYNLDVGSNPKGTDFVEYFLFDSHEGYCAHFASAGVLALRYFGVPARYVTGYAVSRSAFSVDGNGSYQAEITGKMAHAWVEIYLDQVGWVPVEMTPGTAAISRNGQMEQMEYVAQLAGQRGIMSDASDWREQNEREELPEETPEEDTESGNWPGFQDWMTSGETQEPEKMPESEKTPESVETASGNASETDQTGTQEEGVSGNQGKLPSAVPSGEQGTGNTQGTGSTQGTGITQTGENTGHIFDEKSWGVVLLLLRILCCCLAVGVMLVITVKGYQAKRRRRFQQFQSLGTGDRIFWLYGNLRRTLRFTGCPRALPVDEEAFWQRLREILPKVSREEYDAFCLVLEKNSFAREEPTDEELMAVCGLHDRLVKRVYDRAPFYQKALIGRYWNMCEEGA